MTDMERLSAIEEIKQVKARYFRGVDSGDAALVRSILADDCVLDFRGCCTDPATGRDFLPAMNIVMRGSTSWSDGLSKAGIASVHQGHNCEIELTGDTTAHAIWSMTDRLFMPAGGPFTQMTGYGYYHETYEKVGGAWKTRRFGSLVSGSRASKGEPLTGKSPQRAMASLGSMGIMTLGVAGASDGFVAPVGPPELIATS